MPTHSIARRPLAVGFGFILILTSWCTSAAADEPDCRADLDTDRTVDGGDLGLLFTTWGACATAACPGDFDGDGRVDGRDLGIMIASWGDLPDACFGPTLEEPFHIPTLTDPSTLDVVVLKDWHVDTIDGTTRQKAIEIHVDDWWDDVEIRVPVRLVVPLAVPKVVRAARARRPKGVSGQS